MEKNTVGLKKVLQVVTNVKKDGLKKNLQVVTNKKTVGLEKELHEVTNKKIVGLNKELLEISNKKIVGSQKQLNIEQNKKASVILIIFSCFFAFYISKKHQMTASGTLQSIAYTLLFEFALFFYGNLYKKRINKPYAWWVISCGFIASYCMMFIQPVDKNYSLWMIGGICIACIVDFHFGIVVTYGLICLSLLTNNVSTETAMLQVVVVAIIFICLKFINNIMDFIYSCFLLTSIILTFTIIQGEFVLDSLYKVHTVYFIATSITMLIIACFIKFYLNKREDLRQIIRQDAETFDGVVATSEESFISKDFDIGMIAAFTDERHPLLMRLRNEAPKLYKHSLESAKLSKKAASIIGANEDIAYAGSLYHEIGRLEGMDYIKEGLSLLELYNFPIEVQEAVKQHSCKSDGPKTREAAVVLLTDNIITTMEFLRKSKKTKVTYDKIIENIISLRFKDNTLDNSDLSVQDLKKLHNFYITQFNE